MPIQIPLIPEEFFYRVSTVLDERDYIFDVRWNARDSGWYFDLYDADGDLIRAGIKIMMSAFLGARSADPRYPAGTFIASDLSNEGRDATYLDLGVRVVVLFYTVEELSG